MNNRIKLQRLSEDGTLNRHADLVVDKTFISHDFFDPNDLVQVRYEMMRSVSIDGRSVAAAAKAFGFSRTTFYQASMAFACRGLAGLLPQMRGPKGAHKISDAVLVALRDAKASNSEITTKELVHLVSVKFDLTVNDRTIRRALQVAGSKKKSARKDRRLVQDRSR